MDTTSRLTLVPPRDAALPADEAALFEEMLAAHAQAQRGCGLRDKSIHATHVQVRAFARFAAKPPWRWDEHDFADWAASLAGLARASQRKCQSAVRQFLQWALESPRYPYLLRERYGIVLRQIVTRTNAIPHILERDTSRPTPGFEAAQLRRYFAAIDELIDEAERFRTKSLVILLRDRVMFRLLYDYGLRTEELLTLTVHSFFPDGRHPDRGAFGCLEAVGKAPKGQPRKRRTIPSLSAIVRPMMEDYLAHVRPIFLAKAGKDCDLLFLSERGRPLSKAAFFARFQEILRAAALTGRHLSPHSLRRAYATHLLEANVPIGVVSSYLGHAFISTTQSYIRLGSEYVDRETAKVIRRVDEATARLTADGRTP